MNWRILLFPFAGIWWLITQIRNLLYSAGIFPSTDFKKAIIVIGNLSVGGTGKSPHAIYVLDLLRENFKVAALSRGYGRETSGFIVANYDSNAQQIGDEPMQFFNRFKNRIVVSVGEDRVAAIKELFARFKLDAVVLDDAFQHRKLKTDFNILLTSYKNLYSNDYVLPVGTLRESRLNADRANIIVVTKTPSKLTEDEKSKIAKELKIKEYQHLFFSKIVYSHELKHYDLPMDIESAKDYNVLLITGIAHAKPFINFCKIQFKQVNHLNYPDHYNFKPNDIEQIGEVYKEMEGPKLILTTEKDYMRLKQEYAIIENLYYLPISVEVDDADTFNQIILDYVTKNSRGH
ncbi:tetraacyldisaccharide 4'-kinase [Flavobacteriaceae bacterium Ap0902]|nr:tetraacyldisaccharide 4'-kinase [Flavobacteriaceae bacterium Ap0902]